MPRAGQIATGAALIAVIAAAAASESRGGQPLSTTLHNTKTLAPSDASVKDDLLRGVEQIRAAPGGKKLFPQLARTLEKLRRDRASTAAGRRGRELALQGFTWTLKAIRTQLDMAKYDSGNLEASVKDARRADRYLNRGANLLRAAGRAFAISIGKLNGH